MATRFEDDSFFALSGRTVAQSPVFARLAGLPSDGGQVLHDNGAGLVTGKAMPDRQHVLQRDGVLLLAQGDLRRLKRPQDAPAAAPDIAEEIFAAYRARGSSFVSELSGTFRLILLDQESNEILVATDRLGILPVVYLALPDGTVAFASDSQLLLALTGVPTALDQTAIYDYLFFHQVPSPRSIFRDVSRMLPGHSCRVIKGELAMTQYWRPAFRSGEQGTRPPREAELLPTLEKAISATAPDDRTACFLSGGLDSSTVAGVLAKIGVGKAHAFSIGFSEPGYDEMEYARLAARHFGLELHEYYVTPQDVAEALPMISATYDEPFGNSSAVPAYFCASKAREAGYDRLLAGDGGDELFAGNARYAKQKLFQQFFRLPAFVRERLLSETVLGTYLFRRTWPFRKIARYAEQARQPLPDRLESANPLHYFKDHEIFAHDFLASIDLQEPYRLMRDWYARADSDHYLNRMLWLDWKFTLTDNDLRKVNVMCRKAGTSVSYPMLDEAMIDLSVRIPPSAKLRHFKLRSWYKSAVRGFLPDEILSKKKHGFGLPFGEWLRKPGPMQDMAEESLRRAAQLGIFNEGFIAELRRRHQDVHASHYGTLVWVVIMLEQWLGSRKITL